MEWQDGHHSQHAMYHSPLNQWEARAVGSRWPMMKTAAIWQKGQRYPTRTGCSPYEKGTTAAAKADNMDSLDQRGINVDGRTRIRMRVRACIIWILTINLLYPLQRMLSSTAAQSTLRESMPKR